MQIKRKSLDKPWQISGNQPFHIQTQAFAGRWIQQLCRATEKIKSHYEGSCEERDH